MAVLVLAPITECSAWNIRRGLFDGTNPAMEFLFDWLAQRSGLYVVPWGLT